MVLQRLCIFPPQLLSHSSLSLLFSTFDTTIAASKCAGQYNIIYLSALGRIKILTGCIWPPGRSLSTPAIEPLSYCHSDLPHKFTNLEKLVISFPLTRLYERGNCIFKSVAHGVACSGLYSHSGNKASDSNTLCSRFGTYRIKRSQRCCTL